MTTISRVTALLLPVAVLVGCNPLAPTQTAPPASALPRVSAATFETEVLRSEQPVLVEVGVDYACARCDTMKPRVADVARRFKGQAKLVRVDFRADAALAQQLGVSVCPTYLVVHEGEVVDSVVGETLTPILISRLAAVVDVAMEEPQPSDFLRSR